MPEIVKPAEGEETPSNFIQDYIVEDLKAGGQFEGKQVHTRFPPEPNGYLHIGHAKAVCIDFGTAEKFGGICNLRMDDTNPTKEDVEYVDAIKEDIHWLGFDWDDRFYYASEYFEKMYEFACRLIEKGLAYVCELTPEQMRENRGDLTHPAVSPYRDRPKEESLELFRRMRAGEFEDGKMTLRAKIDLASGNFNMRDPVIYRINRARHHRTGDTWCIYLCMISPILSRICWRESPIPYVPWSLRTIGLCTTGWLIMWTAPVSRGRSNSPDWALTIR